ncbi:MAG: hypothetical protein EBR85_09495, partial [Betaproteobacteria bacterium]|nr:hypothetical protein [Betaproteobacteria bacterium]
FTIMPHLAYVLFPRQIVKTLLGIRKYSTVRASANEFGGITQTSPLKSTNEALSGAPQTVNESPYETGWLFKLQPASAGAEQALLTMEQYTAGPGAH